MVAHAQTPLVLRVGDVLLQPLKCWACSLIEAEEETIYSHIGVVLALSPEIVVGEAFGKVRKLSLAAFNAKTEPGQKLTVIRFRNDDLSEDIHQAADAFMKNFDEKGNFNPPPKPEEVIKEYFNSSMKVVYEFLGGKK